MLVTIPIGRKRRTSAQVTSGLLPELAAGQPTANYPWLDKRTGVQWIEMLSSELA